MIRPRVTVLPTFQRVIFIGTLLVFFSTGIAGQIIIKPGDTNRFFQGWGTSICWWGNIIGNYPEKTRDSIFDLVFDTASGLGLNIIRYNIGGGDAPAHNHMGVGKEMEGFLSGPSTAYDWTKDSGQRRVVQAAKERIPADWFVAEAFSNSPPYWMTVSGCASGGTSSADNLKSDMYAQFADYLIEVVRHFRDAWGVTFSTLEPFNEPMGNWWNVNGGQEGCSFSRTNQPKLIKEVHAHLADQQLTTKIAASDEAGYDDMVATWNSYDSLTRSRVFQINSHGYSGTKRAELRRLADRDGKRLWASEIDGSGAPAPFDKWKHDHTDIAPALDIAGRIIRDLRELKPDGWIFWQVVESEQAQINLDKNWGCIHADYTGGNRFFICKKFHAMRQFTAFVRPGSRPVDCSGSEGVAFLAPEGDRIVIIQRNTATAAVSHEITFSDFTLAGSSARIYRTSASENFVRLDDLPFTGSTLQVTAKAQSITTLCIELATSTAIAPVARSSRYENTSTSLVTVSRSGRQGLVFKNKSGRIAVVSLYDLHGIHLAEVTVNPGVHQYESPVPLVARILLAEMSTAGKRVCRTIVHSAF